VGKPTGERRERWLVFKHRDACHVAWQSRVFYSMAHDGLLFFVGNGRACSSAFRTPWKSTAITGFVPPSSAPFVSDWQSGPGWLAEDASGVLSCLRRGCDFAQRRPDLPRLSRPVGSVWFRSLALSFPGTNGQSQSRYLGTFVVWLAIGMVIYFTYGVKMQGEKRAIE